MNLGPRFSTLLPSAATTRGRPDALELLTTPTTQESGSEDNLVEPTPVLWRIEFAPPSGRESEFPHEVIEARPQAATNRPPERPTSSTSNISLTTDGFLPIPRDSTVASARRVQQTIHSVLPPPGLITTSGTQPNPDVAPSPPQATTSTCLVDHVSRATGTAERPGLRPHPQQPHEAPRRDWQHVYLVPREPRAHSLKRTIGKLLGPRRAAVKRLIPARLPEPDYPTATSRSCLSALIQTTQLPRIRARLAAAQISIQPFTPPREQGQGDSRLQAEATEAATSPSTCLPVINRPEPPLPVCTEDVEIPDLSWTLVRLQPRVTLETDIKPRIRTLLGSQGCNIRSIRRRRKHHASKSQLIGSDKFDYHAIVKTDLLPHITKLLAAGQITVHRPDSQRFISRRATSSNSSKHRARLNIFSWNINGIASKRPSIRAFCAMEKVGVLALQETNRIETMYSLHIQDYQCFESPAVEGSGARGLATLIHLSLGAQMIGPPHSNVVAVRIPNCHGVKVIVLNVYIPCAGPSRAIARREVKIILNDLRFSNPDYTFVLLGDLNTTPGPATRWLTSLHLSPNKWAGSNLTRRSNLQEIEGRYTALDYLAISGPQSDALLGSSRVRRCWRESDHFPVRARIRPSAPADPIPIARPLHVRKVTTLQQSCITKHIPWAVLADLDLPEPTFTTTPEAADSGLLSPSDATARLPSIPSSASSLSDTPPPCTLPKHCSPYQDLDRAAKAFVQESRAVTSSVFGTSRPAQPLVLNKSNTATARLLRKKHLAMKTFNALPSAEKAQQRMTLLAISKACDKAIRSAGRQAWLAWLQSQLLAAHAGNTKSQWRLIDRVLHRGKPPQAATPMSTTNGDMVISPPDLAKVWHDHYQPLFADATGHSKDASFWSNPEATAPAHNLDDINGPISLDEVRAALHRVKNGKAPGDDTLTYEFLKAALDDDNPAMLHIIHRITETMWITGYVPEVWQSATLVNIAKKGDLSDPGNYRGISLICNMVKILCLIVNRRMYDAVEKHHILAKEQAGFRQREECVAQAFALREITLRRIRAFEPTYLAFIDFQKAYDMVPHEGLFHKLDQLGFSGTTMRFLRGLYSNSTVRVKVNDSTFTDPIPVLRGLRQGCPLSPLLFNLFINDLPAAINAAADLAYIPSSETQISSLLFADDVVLIAADPESLQHKLSAVATWTSSNEMTIGITKCGVLATGLSPPLTTPVLLGREEVPIVEKYTYLGLQFDQQVTTHSITRARLTIAKATWAKLKPLARDASVPVITRQLLARNIALPILLYGAELFPHDMTRLQPLQAEVNRWMRDLLRLGLCKGNPLSMSYELDLPILSMAVRAYQHRATLKFPTLQTYAADLMDRPFVGYRDPTTSRADHIAFTDSTSSLLQRNTQHLKRQYPELVSDELRPVKARSLSHARLATLSTQPSTPHTFKNYVRDRCQPERPDSQYYLPAMLSRPSDAAAIHHFTRARLDTFYTGASYTFLNLDPRHKTHCHLCDAPGCETLLHMFFECPAREELRQSTGLSTLVASQPREPSTTEMEWQKSTLNFLLGSQVERASQNDSHTHFVRVIIVGRFLKRCHRRCRPPERLDAGS